MLEMVFQCVSCAGVVRLSVGAKGQQGVRDVWTGVSGVKGMMGSCVRMDACPV